MVMVQWDGGAEQKIATTHLTLLNDSTGNALNAPPNFQRASDLPYQPIFNIGDEVRLKRAPQKPQVVVRITFEANTGVPLYYILTGSRADFVPSGDHLTFSRPVGGYRPDNHDPSYLAEELERA